MKTQPKTKLSFDATKRQERPKIASKSNKDVSKKSTTTKKQTSNQTQIDNSDITKRNDNSNDTVEVNYDKVYAYFIDYNNLSNILKFLDIDDLIKCGGLNLKIRLMIKWHFTDNSFAEEQKVYEKEKKNSLQKTIIDHFQRRDQLKRLISQGLQKELLKLNTSKDSVYIKSIQAAMNVNGINIKSINQVLPYIQENGLLHCFSEIFEPRIIKPKEEIPEYKQFNHENIHIRELLNILFQYVQEKKEYKYPFTKQKPVIQKYLIYNYQRLFEKLKPKVISEFRQRNMKERNLFDFSNKNTFGIIVQFLDSKDILNLRLSSKQISTIMDPSIEIKLQRLQEKRDALLNLYKIPQEYLSILENYSHLQYCLDVTKGFFVSHEVNIPVCEEILTKLMAVNIPSIPLNKNIYLYKLKDNYYQINKELVVEVLKQFIISNSVESIEKQIKNHPNYQKERNGLYFSFLFRYMMCILQTCEQNIPAVNIKRSFEDYQKYIENTQQEIYYIRILLQHTNEKIPIYFKNCYPPKRNVGYKANGLLNVFG